jgi:hypothetical protein
MNASLVRIPASTFVGWSVSELRYDPDLPLKLRRHPIDGALVVDVISR